MDDGTDRPKQRRKSYYRAPNNSPHITLATLSATLRMRPTRIGFLVNPMDIGTVRQVMQVCACLWGGVYNPIIPVCPVLPEAWKRPPFRDPTPEALARGYIEFFEPDVYVEAEEGLAVRLGIENIDLEIGTKRVAALSEFLAEPTARNDGPPFGLSIFDLYKALYEREFKFKSRHAARIGLFTAASREDEPFVEAVCGGFPKKGRFAHIERAYCDAFAPRAVKLAPKTWETSVREGWRSALQFTREGIDRAPGNGLEDPILFIADPTNPLDLVDLWNIRLFQRNVLAINARWFRALSPFLRDCIKRNYRPLPDNSHGVMIHTTLEFGRSIGEARAKDLVEEAKLRQLPQGSWHFKLWYHSIWSPHRDDFVWHPTRARITAKTQNLELPIDDEGERNVRFPNLSPEFAPRYANNAGGWVNVVRFHTYGSHSTLALNFPSDFNPQRTRHLRVGGIVLPSREGFVLPQHFKDHGEYLRLLSGRDAMAEWLEQHGIKAVVSSSGRVAEQVIDSISGSMGIKLLAHANTVHLLDRMAKSVRKYADGTVEEYQDRTAAATEWQSLIARRQKDMWSSHVTLDHFIRANVLKLGLALQCTHCLSLNWYAIGELKETLTCERCRRAYSFPQGSIGFTNSPWKFRVVGPFSVPGYADGAYATALTLRVFSDTLSGGHSHITYSPGIALSVPGRDRPIEVDFALWYRRDQWFDDEDETVTVFGEAKSFGTKCFHKNDVERMRAIANLFPGAFLVFAALKENLDPAEKEELKRFARWGREPLDDGRPRAPVIVLTGAELFTSWRISHTWEKSDGKRKQFADAGHVRFDNLWTFADVTQQVYLELPSRSEELHRKWEAQAAAARAKAAKAAKADKPGKSTRPRKRT